MKLNKFFPILIIIFFLFSISIFLASAQERGLEVQYPIMGGEEITTSTTIAEYAVYVFNFSIVLAAIIAFAVLIYGGFRYVTSSGNPIVMGDAKKWILSAIIGLALILFSYIMLNIINANFINPEVEVIEPVGGILLLDENGVPKPLADGIAEIPEDFNAVTIQFFSPMPKNSLLADIKKQELISIFYYSETNFQGDVEKVENNKSSDSDGPSAEQGLSFPPRSIAFFWLESGVHLYEKENFETPPIPKISKSGEKNLGDIGSKIKSISLVNKGEDGETIFEEYYTAVIFEDTDYQGQCDLVLAPYNVVDRLKEKISSIAVAKGTEIYGDVIFYDKENCEMEKGNEGKEYRYSPDTLGDLRYGVVKLKDMIDIKQWMSIKINGNLSVLLNTEEDLKGRCAVFDQIGCISSLKGTYVFSSDPEGFRPQEAYIFSSFK